jgi:hypothetical protein
LLKIFIELVHSASNAQNNWRNWLILVQVVYRCQYNANLYLKT